MTQNQENSPVQQEVKPDNKEYNFRALEEKYRRELSAANARAEQAEKEAQEAKQRQTQVEEEDDDSDPYVDKRKLEKKLSKFGQSTQSEIQRAMVMAKEQAKEELKQEMWVEENPDFYDVIKNNAERFFQRSPKLAENILKMPDTFERQKLVYQTIKELGLHEPEKKGSSVQDKIDANRRNPYYQPSGVGTSPYSSQGDFSTSGQKNAYAKMQELKAKMRI